MEIERVTFEDVEIAIFNASYAYQIWFLCEIFEGREEITDEQHLIALSFCKMMEEITKLLPEEPDHDTLMRFVRTVVKQRLAELN
jgi:hypothetical protein